MTSLPEPVSEHRITLNDGRQLGYAEYGSPMGLPVLFCHGAPGSRLSIFPDMHLFAAKRGIRLIAPDRPGYGLSDFVSTNSLLSWTNDAYELLTQLDIKRIKVIGFSMGSMSAFACAYALSEQVESLTIVGSAAPMEMEGVLDGLSASSRDLFALARVDKVAFHHAITAMANDGPSLFAVMAATMSEPDKIILSANTPAFTKDFETTMATGALGVINDLVLAANPWVFSPAKIKCHVDLWVGSEDTNTPPAMSRYMASVLPDNRLFELPGEGHCCLYTQWENILDTLLEPMY